MALGWDGAITIVVLSLGLIAMMGDWLAPHLTFTLMVGVLMAATVIDTRAGASGFSNTGVLTVVVLYAVAEGVSQTGGLDRIMSRVLGTTATSATAALIRMMLPVAIASAFLNNTPIVALMIPILISWGRRCNVSPKVLLLPLSYASIFGGTTTLIGTSTNLVISGMQSRRYAGTPNASFNFFDITPFGLPYGVWGFVYVLIFRKFLLPKDTGSRPREDLLLAAEVGPSASQVIGQSVAESGLTELSGVRLFSVIRQGQLLYKAPAEAHTKKILWNSSSKRPAASHTPKPHFDSPRTAQQHRGEAHLGSSMIVEIDSADPQASPSEVQLQVGDLLHFQGDLKQLTEHSDRLGLIMITSNNTHLQDVLHAAAKGRPNLPTSSIFNPTSTADVGALRDNVLHTSAQNTHGLFGSAISRKGQSESDPVLSAPRGTASLNRRASMGWSGATMWLFRAVVKKDSSVVGKSLESVDFWHAFGVIVIGAELKDKKVSTASLAQLVLQPGDLLIFTARNDFNYTTSNFAENFTKVEFIRDQKPKDFILGMRVKPGRSGAGGKDIAANGLKDINGLYIVAISRPAANQLFSDLSPNFVLEAEDVLWFAADLEGVKYLLKDLRLQAVEAADATKLKGKQIYRRLVQATVSPNSSLIGHSARKLRFRTYFEGTILAIHRQSGSVQLTSPADVDLNAGDVLLLEADEGFRKRFSSHPAFGLVADVPRSSPLKTKLMWPAVALTAAMVTTQIISGFTGKSYIDLWPAAILTAAAMLAIGCMNAEQALQAIDWTVYITIAFAFGMSSAMEKSGVAQGIASLFVTISKAIGGRTAALGAMYLVTGLLSEVLTNNAAAALMYPIAANVGDDMGIEPKIMSIAVMLGASAAFISPFGYQCNLMVFNAGQYRTMDFVKVGVLLQLWQLLGACVILSMPGQAIVLSAVSLFIVAVAVAYAVFASWIGKRKLAQQRRQAAASVELTGPSVSVTATN